MRWNEQFIRSTIPEVNFLYTQFPDRVTISIDSRTLEKGDIFCALKGLNADGHNFIDQAITRGAAGLIIERDKKDCLKKCDEKKLKDILVLCVPDTYQALMQLATAWRRKFSYPVIGITGSIGKTTTKEIVGRILNEANIPHTLSLGNRNSMIGLALSIFQMTPEHKVAIFEMGVNKRGEMRQLAHMANPTAAVITYVGHAHMEGLGSIADIASEKRDIFSCFKEDNIGIINGDQSFTNVGYRHPVIKFGTKTTNQIQARKIVVQEQTIEYVLKLYGKKYTVSLPTNHQGAIYNSLAAISVAYHLNIPAEVIMNVIQKPVIVAGRNEYRSLKNKKGTVINDCYNASPEAMKAALVSFQNIPHSGKKIAVLGDMLELGIQSPFWHRQLARIIQKEVPSLNKVILVGSLVKATKAEWDKKAVFATITVEHVSSWQEAQETLERELENDNLVLVKGSLGVNLWKLVQNIT